ncbi:hypothetical protein COT99_03095 [Candidatus Falkowbacteria bacterium CG10_big_fil_rev_8_21_14_0_10_43_10]|uniref:Uncharacterized protein n=1 Tax=Candidatus Falkowbacteria bacterium CG10_big_fil_rev_8_21_14_0_10_43_10 TaxID=1974567 RepID=A0A2H0V1Q6_9BACT|nr:MAG: hypothetical protein COT99_03095 [Candidatus Falkowbacteria bacterium CG10_big_fil_rev_8_21_14_0_10_43_10]
MFLSRKSPLEQALKKITPLDLVLIKLSALFAGLFLASLIPEFTEVEWYWYLALAIILAAKPLGIIYKK